MDDIPSRTVFGQGSLQLDGDGVSARELLCRPLPALKDNRAEAEESLAEAVKANGAGAYKPGVYLMMDWVAARLSKAGAALWAYLLGGEPAEWAAIEFDLFSVLDVDLAVSVEVACAAALRACIA